ncbi:hypothetical protein [Nocardia brasiliensis]|uniref:hypothetical protein n=1 Tax=Nocardia brasiliensis TaxID=37326 RepID=UPI001894B0D3|nr:hypothetical protein [Nocardia brasiliensis]MBF6545299.1 hypothetical protein [Nocardia brasiliensis]
MTNVRETPARLRLRQLGVVLDLVLTGVMLAWWLMAATGHSDGDIRILAVCVLACVVLSGIRWWRLRGAQRRAQHEPQVQR